MISIFKKTDYDQIRRSGDKAVLDYFNKKIENGRYRTVISGEQTWIETDDVAIRFDKYIDTASNNVAQVDRAVRAMNERNMRTF